MHTTRRRTGVALAALVLAVITTMTGLAGSGAGPAGAADLIPTTITVHEQHNAQLVNTIISASISPGFAAGMDVGLIDPSGATVDPYYWTTDDNGAPKITSTYWEPGRWKITLTFAGDATYAATTKTQYFWVGPEGHVIDFPEITGQTFGDPAADLAATSSKGLPISYAADGPCTIVGDTKVAATGAGTCKVTASQAGDGTVPAATSVERSFAIAKAATRSTLTGSATIVGAGDPVTLTAAVAGPGFPTGPVSFTATPTSGAPITGSAGVDPMGSATWTPTTLPPGTYSIVAAYGGGADWLGSTTTAVPLRVMTPSEEAVAAAYQSVLGRFPDIPGLEFWAGQLGSRTTAQVADAIAKSREGRTRLVASIHLSVLDRAPSTDERDRWVGDLMAGRTTPETMVATLYSGVTTNPVDVLYRIHLGWAPATAERTYWGPRTDTAAERRSASLTVGRSADALKHLIRRATHAACGSGHPVPTGAALTAVQGFARDTGYDPIRVTARLAATHCPTT